MTLTLPPDIKASLRNGFDCSVEQNSRALAQELRKPRDAAQDWADGFRGAAGSLKSMSGFQLSVRLLGVLQELRAIEGIKPSHDLHTYAEY
jgi:hypothetical protein